MPGVKHRPDDCPRKSSKGDMLSMHYTGTFNTAQALDTHTTLTCVVLHMTHTGTLYKDGSKFDSRLVSHTR